VNTELRERAEKVLQYTFKNEDLLLEALTHASIADNRLSSNERMEFLGDAVLDLIICHALYERFPTYQEGDLTKIDANHLLEWRDNDDQARAFCGSLHAAKKEDYAAFVLVEDLDAAQDPDDQNDDRNAEEWKHKCLPVCG